MVKHEQWVWKPPRSMIKSAEASGADKSKLESSAVLRKVQRDFRMMTLDRPGDKPMHLQAWPSVLKKERRHAQMMAELLGKEVAPEKQLEEMRRKMRCDLGVPSCRDAFTPSTRLVSIRRGRGWFIFRFRGHSDRVERPRVSLHAVLSRRRRRPPRRRGGGRRRPDVVRGCIASMALGRRSSARVATMAWSGVATPSPRHTHRAKSERTSHREKQRRHPMGAWSSDSKSHVAHMQGDDFYGSEQSHVVPFDVKEASTHKDAGVVRIEFVGEDGTTKILKNKTPLQPGEVIDASKMDVQALRDFYKREIDDAKNKGVLFSLHLKATMMKVSDPIMFGHCVEVFYRDTFAKHADFVKEHQVDATKGLGDFYAKLEACGDDALKEQISSELEECLKSCDHVRPPLAMVDSDRGVTNLHVPSDIIIDASMPAALRESGKMWGPDGELADTKYVIPDRSYATSYKKVVEHCIEHGAFDPSTMGAVSNVGLMAQKAQEYGSHDKTFEAPAQGSIRVVARDTGDVLMEHAVKEGDIWRMCQTKDSPIQDWVRLAVARARATESPAIFWLDSTRAHDANLIQKVETYLKDHDTTGLDIRIMAPEHAMEETLMRSRKGLDTVSVTGNVLRDYLTDLFPILELGTSAKMLSIVPLLAGGGLFETGAGGSAPKHVQQLQAKNHLRWDSLGEFLALAVSIEDLAEKTSNAKAAVVADALNDGIGKLLAENKSPKRKPGLLDNRGSHFYLALYWADAMASQTKAP